MAHEPTIRVGIFKVVATLAATCEGGALYVVAPSWHARNGKLIPRAYWLQDDRYPMPRPWTRTVRSGFRQTGRNAPMPPLGGGRWAWVAGKGEAQ